ncbi:probable glutamate receptor [Periplaneta americana]|uniref:probable glutamate receptor n=1 Tax=Periplaneta americana TaxID=6978 RepID=UPI0037E796E1
MVMRPEINSCNELVYLDGLEIRLLNSVMEAINATLVYHPALLGEWGVRLENGTWTGLFGNPINKVSDVSIGVAIVDAALWELADFTIPHLIFDMSWHVPCAKPIPRWTSLFRAFSTELWFMFVFVYFAVSIVIWTTLWMIGIEAKKSRTNLGICFLSMWAVVLGTSSSTFFPSKASIRFIFLIWVLYSLAINTVYQTYLTSFLIDPGLEKQFNTEEELINSNLKLGYHYFMGHRYKELLTQRYKRRMMCDDLERCFSRLAYRGDMALLMSVSVGRYKSIFKYSSPSGSPGFCHLKEVFAKVLIGMLLQKGSPFLEVFNAVVLRLSEAGMMGYWWNDIIHMAFLTGNTHLTSSDSESYSQLSTVHMQSAFYSLLLGYLLSIIIAACEIAVKKWMKVWKLRL